MNLLLVILLIVLLFGGGYGYRSNWHPASTSLVGVLVIVLIVALTLRLI